VPFDNPQPVMQPLNINKATEADLMALFGAELGKLVYKIATRMRISNEDVLLNQIAYAAGLESKINVYGEKLGSVRHLISF